jgi:hypothetical protein
VNYKVKVGKNASRLAATEIPTGQVRAFLLFDRLRRAVDDDLRSPRRRPRQVVTRGTIWGLEMTPSAPAWDCRGA